MKQILAKQAKNSKNHKKYNLTSQCIAQHPLAGQNMQQVSKNERV